MARHAGIRVCEAASLAICLVFLFFGSSPLAAADAPARPNIVYILADDLGYQDVGYMGSRNFHTPRLDELAKAGTIFDCFYVQPVCSPTRAALMTGRYAAHTGVYTIVRPHARWGLPLEERTLAQALREAGYETAICGKWHLGEFRPEYRPTMRGFDHQYGMWFGAIDYYTHVRDGVHDWHRDDQPCDDKGYSTHLIAQEACRLIRERRPGKPLFLYVPFNAVHMPHQVPEKYTEPYKSLRHSQVYAGMIAAMDEAVGQIVAELEKQGLRDSTLILFSSDNGGTSAGSNGPLRAGKGTLYEGGVRSCSFACWPGHISAGARVSEPMHAVDWYPTLLKLAGASLEQKLPLDGRDIWPTIAQGAKSPHEAILLCGPKRDRAALRMGDWKLLMNAPKDQSDAGKTIANAAVKTEDGTFELYNLEQDLGELNDLAAKDPERLKEMRAKLKAMLSGALEGGDIGAEQDKE